jgi:carboxylesterase
LKYGNALTDWKLMALTSQSCDSSQPRRDFDGTPACLFLHGLGGGLHEIDPLLAAIAAGGGPVAAPVLPGHRVEGRIMPASRWQDWIRTAETAFDELAATGRPVVIVGFSTGGTLALELATRRPVAALVLLAPFLAIRHSHWLPFDAIAVLRIVSRFWPDWPRRRSPVRDRSARRQLTRINRFSTFSLQATLSALELIEIVKPKVAEIRARALIIQGQCDSVVEPRAVRWLYDHLGSSEKRLVVLPRSDHLLALDLEREKTLALATEFVLGT